MAPHLPWRFLQFLLLLLGFSSAQARVNITLGSSLKAQGANSSWLSPSGDFAFGFWPVEGNPSSYLLAVWFDKIPEKTVAWYAKSSSDGQESPVQVPSSSVLHLTTDGLLSLRNPSGDEVWSPQAPGVAYARMLDTGNFMLVDADGKAKWETFGVPADTILPTQVLRVGPENKLLRSRLINMDNSNGRFLLAVQTDGNLVLYSMDEHSAHEYGAYWASNTVGNGSQLVFNETGRVYFTLKNGRHINITSAGVTSMDDFFNRATLDPDGVFRQYVYPKSRKARSIWRWEMVSSVPEDICQAVSVEAGSGACGFNSYCTFDGTKNQTSCQCPQYYKFFDNERQYKGCRPDFVPQSCDLDEAAATAQFEMTPIDRVDWPQSDYEQYSPIDETECRRLCVLDCFCATAVFQASTNTCWKKNLPLSNGHMTESVNRTILIKVPRSNNAQSQLSSGSSKWKKDKKYWILGSSLFFGTSVLLSLLLISILLFGTYCGISITFKKKLQSPQSSGSSILPPKIFTYNELEKATSGFHEVLGSGASGTVYKGQLQDEHVTSIAVKKIKKLQQETEKEFMVEVQTMGQTSHKNLVRLLGLCNEGTDRLLVYEFMTNGSLNEFLFGDARPHWSLRVQVALGVARGLLYLHEECSTQIIHCDIKPQNILLDANFMAKIADFGLTKLLRANQTQTNTGIRGTRGYVAPEWFKNIAITSKVDVYSFGVILLELVCCRRNVEVEIADEDQATLTYWANDCYRCGRIDLLVEGDDEAIFNMKKAERFVAVALWCLQEEPMMRPTMLKVTQMLDGAVQIPIPPDPSSFISSLQ
ncbi:hypothetical protein CFC21_027505 [Triticum aestivum]|uniref:Receptor-like serine/threonine-protein kinase n=2 Tax=Triticum aestivum TaxID=4565 RepID=A0A3B6D5B2_WHEAT|nr:G-type lectin S-receptor-like serine/threonine-protein kinase LECRK2 [Triticum aestivum]KAF7013421.1 hypothetical protein CFC21_027505 [Triticum aestivum]